MSIKEIFNSMEYGPAPEGAELANQWLDAHNRTFGFYIGGKWDAASSHFETKNPADKSVLGKIGQGTQADVDHAVDAAKKAFPAWSKLSGHQRSRYLYAIARQIQKHSRLFAVLESMDNGKPIRETRDLDIPLVARHFYHHAGWAQMIETEFPGYEPVGVCGQIIPWNFPLLMLAWKIAPALAAGNTVVLKPAEFTSLTALLFAEICDQVGLPKGVVNIITGDGSTGAAIVGHDDIGKLAFTGSTEVGRIIRRASAGSGKKLSLELGGKSPYIVFEDADIDGAIEGLVDAIWFNQGQVCCAGSRLLVQESIAEAFLAKLKKRMSTLRVGQPLDKAVDIGAIVDQVQLERIDSLVQQGVREGAELFQPKCDCPTSGWFYPPTLLANVEPAHTVAQEEIFGPVLVSMTFKTYSEAIELANNTVYGLAASVWTENLNLAHDMASKLKAGAVWLNCSNMFDAAAGFGGYRESGYGREGGKEGMYEYLKPTSLYLSSNPKSASVKAGTSSGIDVTHKLYVGGKQARPDGGYSLTLDTARGPVEVARGNRKDIRNAVESACGAASSWGSTTGHARAQVLYYLAENLSQERERMVLALMDRGASKADAAKEFDASIERIWHYAGWADKYDGQVHTSPMRGYVLTANEPLGATAVVCSDHAPLLGFLSATLPLIAMGNAVIAIPSEHNPLPALELYRVLEASDVPGGVFNIITGEHAELEKTLGDHLGLAAVWHFGSAVGGKLIEETSAGNLKQTWCSLGHALDWNSTPSREFLRRATQVKNVWVPYGA